ncbi:LamG-like jellyroll fold domain-containing protein [Niastella yeongjuensis]|nr:LamG-like jellyroll fold domain-containing protein [Niastella yeongjuensis]SEP19405.1 IPT/TIG domain-containing protein [Niastella yeongjuensis]
MKIFTKNIWFLVALIAAAAIYAGCNKAADIRTFDYPAPIPQAVFPDSGYAGFAEVTITGSSFGDYKNAVKVLFNGIEADSILTCEDGKIVARVPNTAISGKVSLQVWNHSVDSIGSFKVIPVPHADSISRIAGLVGDTIIIMGRGFGADLTKVKVSFNGPTGDIADITDSTIAAIVPAGFTAGKLVVYVNNYPVVGPAFGALVTVADPIYWLEFEHNLNDKMGGAAATYTYNAADGFAKPINWAAGNRGEAVQLAGTGNRKTTNNQFIACPPGISKYSELSVTAWVNWGSRDYPDSNWYQEPVFDFGQARGLRTALMTRMGVTAGPNMLGRLIFEKITEFPTNKTFDAKCTAALGRFAWHHVAMTISSANHILTVYLDGVSIGTVTLDAAANPTLFNHNKVYIGAPTNGVVNEPAYGGLIDDFKIFNYTLSSEQVFTDYYHAYRPK